MAGQTSRSNIQYPESTDLVSAYPALAKEAAQTIDNELAALRQTIASTATSGSARIRQARYAGILVYLELSGLTARGGAPYISSSYRPKREISVAVAETSGLGGQGVAAAGVITISTSGRVDCSQLDSAGRYGGTVSYIQ